MMGGRSLRNRERGAAWIETAVVLPVVLLLILGVIDIGRILATSAKVQEAAQEGALFASYSPGDYLDTRDRVLDSLSDFTIDTTDITVVCGPGDTISVTTTHDLDLVTPWIGDMLGSTITLTGEAVGQNFSTDTCDPTP